MYACVETHHSPRNAESQPAVSPHSQGMVCLASTLVESCRKPSLTTNDSVASVKLVSMSVKQIKVFQKIQMSPSLMMQIEREKKREGERGREPEWGKGKESHRGRERERDLMFKILVALSPAQAMCEHPLQIHSRKTGRCTVFVDWFVRALI